MTDEEIIQSILEGCLLRTFMIPDPAIPANSPERTESFDLPHVIINGKTFWGKSENVHLSHVPGKGSADLTAYCYTNIGGVYCVFAPKTGTSAMMRGDSYKTHEWRLVRNFKLIWDSGKKQSTKIVAEEIEACAKFRIAMLDSEGIWNVHPVDLPMYEKDTGRFQMKTVRDSYPLLFRNRALPDDLDAGVKKLGRDEAISLDSPVFESFYSLFSDGTYYNYYDIERNTIKSYERLIVFSDTL